MPGLLDRIFGAPSGGLLDPKMAEMYRRQKIAQSIRDVGGAVQALATGQPPPAPGQGPDIGQMIQLQEYQRQRQAQDARQGKYAEIVGGLDPRSGITWNTGRTSGDVAQTPGYAGKGGSALPPTSPGPGGLLDKMAQQRGMDPSLLRGMLQGMDPQAGAKAMFEMSRPEKAEADPAAIKEYQFARQQGYTGSFVDFQLNQRKAGASNVTVGGAKYGTIPTGYELREGPGGAQLVPIPGGPAAVSAADDAAKAKTQEAATTETSTSKASMMLDAVGGIRDEFKNANTPVTGTLSIPFAQYSGSPAGKVRSYVGALKSGVVLEAMQRLKQASATGSTGFGAMNQSELRILIDAIGALDPDTTDPKIFLKTIDRIEGQYKRVVADIRRNVSPERIAELGLEELLSGAGDAPATPPPAQGGWSIQRVD